MPNWNSDDTKAGFLFVGLGMFFGGYTLLTLDTGTLTDMGPGYFPLCLCIVLTLLGVGTLVRAEALRGGGGARVNWRAVALITAAPVAFGFAVERLGLLPALVLSVSLAVVAERWVGWRRASLTVFGVAVFCIAVFKWGLKVPFDLMNPTLLG